MSTLDQLLAQRDAILAAAAAHGAEDVRIFGSVAREEDSDASDIDVLVRMLPGRSLLDLAALKHDLELLTHRPADIVTENGLHPLIRNRAIAEARAL